MNRRSLLRMLGLGPAAAAAANVAEKSAGLGGGALSALGTFQINPSISDYPDAPPQNENSWLKELTRKLAWASANRMPDFVIERYRDEARHVHRLDPDLAVNRSF